MLLFSNAVISIKSHCWHNDKEDLHINVLTSVDQGKLKQVLNDEKTAYRLAQLDKPRSVEREAAGSNRGGSKSQGR